MAKTTKVSSRLDFGSIGGLLLGIGGIFGGLILEGGKWTDIAQLTAGIIVLGGTIGAVMVTAPMATFLGAVRKFGSIFLEPAYSPRAVIDEILKYTARARRAGIVSLEADVEAIRDPFLRKAMALAVDGTDLQELQSMMELELDVEERTEKAEAKVYEAAGGYAPTIGIIGAVLGLIQVMKHLDDISAVGHGIAVAFVATVYGVAVANLFFIPAGNKLRARVDESIHMKQLMLEGVSAIVQGLHPQLIESRLEAYARKERDQRSPKTRERAQAPLEPSAAAGD